MDMAHFALGEVGLGWSECRVSSSHVLSGIILRFFSILNVVLDPFKNVH